MKQELEAAEEMHRALLEHQKALDGTPDTPDESTEDLERRIADIDSTNAKIRANLDKQKALDEAEEYKRRLELLTAELEAVRGERLALLNGAKMPLADLTIGKDGKGRPILLYKGHPWDCMSTMEQYRVAAAIVRELKPECGFIL